MRRPCFLGDCHSERGEESQLFVWKSGTTETLRFSDKLRVDDVHD
jgi:hypothetical protein